MLERIYASLLKGDGGGELAAAVRKERETKWWELARGVHYGRRKRESPDLVHARRGGQACHDAWLITFWGIDWRDRLREHVDGHNREEGRRRSVQLA
eukprot:2817259-Pyramimonas_sp.AAC.1